MTAGHLIVTGAGGYLGREVVATARARGHRVTALGGSTDDSVTSVPWRLGDAIPDAAFGPGTHAVIHLAYDRRATEAGRPEVNVEGTRLLVDAARRHAVERFIFVSSLSARPSALNAYGRVKAACEDLLVGPSEVVARVGLVYGGAPLSQWGTLFRAVKRWPVIPLIGGERMVQPISRSEVVHGLLQLALQRAPDRRIYILAAPVPLTFREFINRLSIAVVGFRRPTVPVPGKVALAATKFLPLLSLRLRVDKERILGLLGLPVDDSSESLAALGLSLRPVQEGLQDDETCRRRRLLLEAAACLAYSLGAFPPTSLLRRYVQAVRALLDGPAVPSVAYYCPSLLACYEPVRRDDRLRHPLDRRLYLASIVVDTSGCSAIYDYRGDGRLLAAVRLLAGILWEVAMLPARAMLSRRR